MNEPWLVEPANLSDPEPRRVGQFLGLPVEASPLLPDVWVGFDGGAPGTSLAVVWKGNQVLYVLPITNEDLWRFG